MSCSGWFYACRRRVVASARLLPRTAFSACRAVRPTSSLLCLRMQAQVAVIPQRYRPDAQKAEEAVQAAAGAAAGLDQKFGELKKAAKNAYDRIYYGDVLPPVGSFQISYARRVLQLAMAAPGK